MCTGSKICRDASFVTQTSFVTQDARDSNREASHAGHGVDFKEHSGLYELGHTTGSDIQLWFRSKNVFSFSAAGLPFP